MDIQRATAALLVQRHLAMKTLNEQGGDLLQGMIRREVDRFAAEAKRRGSSLEQQAKARLSDENSLKADLAWCGRNGSPTKVHRIQSVVLAAKESITNVVRHAEASVVTLRLRLDAGSFKLEIEDNGRGLGGVDPKAAAARNGLRNMRKRMEDIGGSFWIGPAPEHGVVVRLTAPLNKA